MEKGQIGQKSEIRATVRPVLMLVLVLVIPLAANAQRSTPNTERRTKEDRNQRSAAFVPHRRDYGVPGRSEITNQDDG
jgi:hypothetical protein